MDISDFLSETFDQVLNGTDGNDTITGLDGGTDLIDGGAGDDVIYGRRGSDALFGGAGDDQLYALRGNDTLSGGAGNDSLYSGRDASVLDGGSGDDLLQADMFLGAAHVLTGGAGADTFALVNSAAAALSAVVITDFSPGEDILALPSGESLSVSSGAGDITLTLGSGDTVTLNGITVHDWLVANGTIFDGVTQGGAGVDRIFARAGDDVIAGGAGDDVIGGGAGDDVILGGEGNDSLNGNRGNDTLDGGAGNDTLHGNAGHNLLLGGEGDDYITSGNQGSVLDGGAGDDHLLMRMLSGGDHQVTGGTGADHFEFAYFDDRKHGHVVISDYELGVDSVTIDGMSALDYYLGTEAVLQDTEAGALLYLVSNDTVLFAGVSTADLAASWAGLAPVDLPLV